MIPRTLEEVAADVDELDDALVYDGKRIDDLQAEVDRLTSIVHDLLVASLNGTMCRPRQPVAVVRRRDRSHLRVVN